MVKLELRAPLFYSKDPAQKHKEHREMREEIKENEEILLCFKLNHQESRSIEPDREHFLEDLTFIGRKNNNPSPACASEPSIPLHEPFPNKDNKDVVLPEGSYLFVQCRKDVPLDRDQWLDMAIEQQKDGLWERHKPLNLLYVRFLFEDGAFVTQVFRPLN